MTPDLIASARKGTPLPRFLRWFSNQCVLRQIDMADVPRIWKAVLHPAFAQCWTGPIPHSEAEITEMLRAAQTDWQKGTRYMLAVQRKQAQEFVGWIQLRAKGAQRGLRGVWKLSWFVHPSYVNSSLAVDAFNAAADLAMQSLDARILCADCAPAQVHFSRLLRATGFAEHIPAGSMDPATGRPRPLTLFVLTERDWQARRGSHGAAGGPPTLGGYTQSRLELSLL